MRTTSVLVLMVDGTGLAGSVLFGSLSLWGHCLDLSVSYVVHPLQSQGGWWQFIFSPAVLVSALSLRGKEVHCLVLTFAICMLAWLCFIYIFPPPTLLLVVMQGVISLFGPGAWDWFIPWSLGDLSGCHLFCAPLVDQVVCLLCSVLGLFSVVF